MTDEVPSTTSSERWKADRTTFQRTYDVLVGTTEPASARQFAAWVDCSDNGARQVLEQLVEMGIAERTDTRPATYRRNPSYFRWMRVEKLARDHHPSDLRERLADLLDQDRTLQEKYGVPEPDAVAVEDGPIADHDELHDRWEEVTEWRTIRRDIRILQQAVQRAASRRDEHARA